MPESLRGRSIRYPVSTFEYLENTNAGLQRPAFVVIEGNYTVPFGAVKAAV
jgi:hypothetical protein